MSLDTGSCNAVWDRRCRLLYLPEHWVHGWSVQPNLPLPCLSTASLLVPLALSLCPRNIFMEGLHSFLTPRSGGIRGHQGKDGGMTCSLSSSCHSPTPSRPRLRQRLKSSVSYFLRLFSASRGTQLNTVFIPCPFWSETGRASDWFLISVKSLSVALMLFP